jgi:hypothetical protein
LSRAKQFDIPKISELSRAKQFDIPKISELSRAKQFDIPKISELSRAKQFVNSLIYLIKIQRLKINRFKTKYSGILNKKYSNS